MRKLLMALVLAVAGPTALAMMPTVAAAQPPITVERVTFKPGQSSTLVTRTIHGRETIDFLVNAREGQRLAASMTSNNTAAYFNIMAPGEDYVAFYVGSNGIPLNSFSGTVPKSGDLKFRVYLYRAAARRGESANVRLSISITGQGGTATHLPGNVQSDGGTASHLPEDALVAGTPYNATGRISCVVRTNGPVGDCEFGVIRLGQGSATVTISKLDGHLRTITYYRGTPVGFDQRPGDPARLKSTHEGDQTTVQIGGERYYIPDAVIFGG